jgi:broad specificity phosphatase PhoE
MMALRSGEVRDGAELKGRTMARFVEVRRHTDNDGDVLTPDGVAAALRLGGALAGGYRVAVSTGAQRATQTVGCLLAALGEVVPDGLVVEPGLRSAREDRWRALYREAGSGELAAMRSTDPGFVAEEAAALGAALGRVLERLGDGDRALAVGHSPTNEAAVLGLTGTLIAPLAKGAGVLIAEDQGSFRVDPLDP